jgi:RHS repeat-associated protein
LLIYFSSSVIEDAQNNITTYVYDSHGNRTSVKDANNQATSYTYDNESHLLTALHQLSGSTIDGATYTLDNAGNRTAKTDKRTGVTTNYGYDPIYELKTAMQGTNTTESYTYDAVGNRLTDLGSPAWTYNTSNELNTRPNVTYTYDANGNTQTEVTSAGTTTLNWDFENRLTSVVLPGTGGTVSFKYDPFGHRIYKSSSSGTSVYAYDGSRLVEETNATGTAVARYSQGLHIDEPLAMLRSGATSYYEADGLGSITSLSSTAGSLAQTYTFDSFGKQTASSGSLTNPFQYTARELDSETGLYFYRARYVDPNAGRFLSEDPVRFSAGVNFYAYVKNEPIDFVDPFGFKCTQVTPWQEIPGMSAPNSRKPYASYEDGLFWQLDSWDFANGPEGGTVISCICTWTASRTRIKKFYRENVTEEAWFECADCGKPSQREHRTRTKTKQWEVDSPDKPIWSPETRQTTGPTVQLGRNAGADPSGLSTTCLCPPPAP